jgi:release factor glutamine methyltransferase
MSDIYEPAEDSFLLSEILKDRLPSLLNLNKDMNFLEIGAGSGIHLETASNLGVKKENILSCDIDKKAVDHCKILGFDCVKSDLFKNIKGKFDLVIFNPPYLALDKREPRSSRTATTGGKKGSEIINKFLKQAKKHLKKDGKILLVTSSLTKDVDFGKYSKRQLGNEKLFFEELFVWELT